MSSLNNRLALTIAAGVLNTAVLHSWAFFVLGVHGPGPRTTLATQIGLWSFWIIGTFLLGAIPIYLYFEYNLLSAPLLTILLTANCFFADRLGGSSGEFTVFYIAVWPFFLAVIGVIAAIEYYVRLR